MNRLTVMIVCAVVGLQAAVAFAAPSPSPSLSGILLFPPGTDYIEADATAPGILEGEFDARKFVGWGKTTNPDAAQKTLERLGFVDGYGRTWVQKVTRKVLVELVIAFSGDDGAKKYLAASELADKASPFYQHPIYITGIPAYYGERGYDSTNGVFEDTFVFVKGNDLFVVAAASSKDDLGSTAIDQTAAQYASAPDYTIRPSDQPTSNSASASFAYDAGRITALVLEAVLAVGVVLLVIGLILRSQRRRHRAAMPATTVHMSPDGGYWWDGQSWRNAQFEVPPSAQRSPDGRFWWDGQRWRPVP